ncbi:MAG: hypothetical protein AAB325_13800, partial [Pseudomonadota bacterium]
MAQDAGDGRIDFPISEQFHSTIPNARPRYELDYGIRSIGFRQHIRLGATAFSTSSKLPRQTYSRDRPLRAGAVVDDDSLAPLLGE